eukprot:jgi/Botrbrau1/14633/Bobra.0364s0017.1
MPVTWEVNNTPKRTRGNLFASPSKRLTRQKISLAKIFTFKIKPIIVFPILFAQNKENIHVTLQILLNKNFTNACN